MVDQPLQPFAHPPLPCSLNCICRIPPFRRRGGHLGTLYRLRILGDLHAHRSLSLAQLFPRIVGRFPAIALHLFLIIRAHGLRTLRQCILPHPVPPMKEFELEPGEHIVKQVRKHWFSLSRRAPAVCHRGNRSIALPKLLVFAPQLAYMRRSLTSLLPLMRAAFGDVATRHGPERGAPSRVTSSTRGCSPISAPHYQTTTLFPTARYRACSCHASRMSTNVTGVLPSLLGIGDIRCRLHLKMSSSIVCAAFRL